MTSVQADPPWARDHDHDYHDSDYHDSDHHEKHSKHDKHHKAERRDHFVDDDRVAVHDFYAQNPHRLPPGLAKRGGRLPPGLAKREGELPPGLSRGDAVTPKHEELMLPLPTELEVKLPPPPHEVIRRILGHDIVMIDRQNKKVLDVMRDALPHLEVRR